MADLTQKQLKELVHYDPKTGFITRKTSMPGKSRINRIITKKCDQVYLRIRVLGKQYKVHRLIFLYMTGKFPVNDVDHINRNSTDNRWKNLRDVSRSYNTRNCKANNASKSGIKGVNYNKAKNTWLVRVCINSKPIHLGNFRNKEDAICTRLATEQCLNWLTEGASSSALEYVKENINTSAR